MENKKGISREVLFGIIGVSILVIGVVVLMFVIFYSKPKKIQKEEINAGSVSMTYADEDSGFTISNALPVSDEVGMSSVAADQYFDFTVNTKVNSEAAVKYEISLVKDKTLSTALDTNIRVYLEEQNSGSYVKKFGPETFTPSKKKTDIGSAKGSMVIATVSKEKDSIENYRLRMWLSDKAVVTPDVVQNYSVKVIVKGKAE